MARVPPLGTLSVHGNEPRQKAFDAVTTPIVAASTYAFADTAELRRHFDGLSEREEYGRYGNPTVRAAEKKDRRARCRRRCRPFLQDRKSVV